MANAHEMQRERDVEPLGRWGKAGQTGTRGPEKGAALPTPGTRLAFAVPAERRPHTCKPRLGTPVGKSWNTKHRVPKAPRRNPTALTVWTACKEGRPLVAPDWTRGRSGRPAPGPRGRAAGSAGHGAAAGAAGALRPATRGQPCVCAPRPAGTGLAGSWGGASASAATRHVAGWQGPGENNKMAAAAAGAGLWGRVPLEGRWSRGRAGWAEWCWGAGATWCAVPLSRRGAAGRGQPCEAVRPWAPPGGHRGPKLLSPGPVPFVPADWDRRDPFLGLEGEVRCCRWSGRVLDGPKCILSSLASTLAPASRLCSKGWPWLPLAGGRTPGDTGLKAASPPSPGAAGFCVLCSRELRCDREGAAEPRFSCLTSGHLGRGFGRKSADVGCGVLSRAGGGTASAGAACWRSHHGRRVPARPWGWSQKTGRCGRRDSGLHCPSSPPFRFTRVWDASEAVGKNS